MEAHPIPQNVTSFEFHLVGDMTLKQFSYLASGLVTAYLTFILAFNSYPLVAIPIIIISTLLGTAFAFLPISDRPLDHWVRAYLKAIFSPTKRGWFSPGNNVPVNEADPVFKNRFQIFMMQLGMIATVSLPSTTPVARPTLPSMPPPEAKKEAIIEQSVENLPSDEQLKQTVELAREAQLVQAKIVEAEKRISQIKQSAQSQHLDPATYSNDLSQLFNQLQALIKTAQGLSTQITHISQPGLSSAEPTSATALIAKVVKPTEVKVVETPKAKTTQVMLTSTPNVINGIVTDTLGNYLEGVVVVIHNKDDLPVRASKTNKLGQFAGATPLPDGTYTISLEKDGLVFDVLEVTLKSEVLAPIQIAAKKGANV